MELMTKPGIRPANPRFSSGPCAKRPGWTLDKLSDAFLGRSHRHADGKSKLSEVISKSREILRIPDNYKVAIVPASDTGAVEMSLWSLLGERGVDILVWESFGAGWASDVRNQLKLQDVRVLEAGYGDLPDLSEVDFSRDVVFTWNGTTSGVRVPDGDWIDAGRQGLTICDATSAAFAMPLPWGKLDVVSYSWQKVLGGEAQHGMLVLSPRAVKRLESYSPPWPMPKLFRMTKSGKLNEGIFRGETINTPSMLAVEDALDGLNWARSIGGLDGLVERVTANMAVLEQWVDQSDDFGFLAAVKAQRSPTSVCFNIEADWFQALSDDQKSAAAKKMAKLLDQEGVAYDIGSYRDAPAGLRIWAGATIETSDLTALLPWLNWGLAQIRSEFAK